MSVHQSLIRDLYRVAAIGRRLRDCPGSLWASIANRPIRVARRDRTWRVSLYVLFAVTALNYLAQIPYYIHFYGVHHQAPSPLGATLLGLTFAIFLAGFVLTLRSWRSGWWLLLGFLVVSLIGYLNMVAALVYLIVLVRGRHHVFAAAPTA